MHICLITNCFYTVNFGTLPVSGIILSKVVYMDLAVLSPINYFMEQCFGI
jgi:hypothetical protein